MLTYEELRRIKQEKKRKAYRLKYKKDYNEYHRKYMAKWRQSGGKSCVKSCGKKEERVIPEIHPDTEAVLKSIPTPFGTFEKAKYVICANNSLAPLYFFTTTCHSTEECIEIMKGEFLRRCSYLLQSPKYCCVYKISKGGKELIFRDIIW